MALKFLLQPIEGRVEMASGDPPAGQTRQLRGDFEAVGVGRQPEDRQEEEVFEFANR
jgi:hypothetical protein